MTRAEALTQAADVWRAKLAEAKATRATLDAVEEKARSINARLWMLGRDPTEEEAREEDEAMAIEEAARAAHKAPASDLALALDALLAIAAAPSDVSP